MRKRSRHGRTCSPVLSIIIADIDRYIIGIFLCCLVDPLVASLQPDRHNLVPTFSKLTYHAHSSSPTAWVHRFTTDRCRVQIIRNAAKNGMAKKVTSCDENPAIMFDHDKLVQVRWIAPTPFTSVRTREQTIFLFRCVPCMERAEQCLRKNTGMRSVRAVNVPCAKLSTA